MGAMAYGSDVALVIGLIPMAPNHIVRPPSAPPAHACLMGPRNVCTPPVPTFDASAPAFCHIQPWKGLPTLVRECNTLFVLLESRLALC